MVDMKKINEPVAPGWLILTILGIFSFCVFLAFSPFFLLVLITWLVNPKKVKSIYDSMRDHW